MIRYWLLCFLLAAPSVDANIIPGNIKAFWHFGEAHTATAIVDQTGRGNNLTPYLRINACTAQFRMGRNSAASSGQQVLGSLKGWGHWNRLLTSGEKAALAGGEYYPFNTTPSLLNGLLVYYLLDETGGSTTYADATGRGNDLTATGTTTQVTGPNGGGDKGTNLTDGVYLTKSSPGTDLRSSQASTTIAGWVSLDSKPAGATAQQVFWGQLVNNTATSGFNVYFDPTADRFAADFDAGDGAVLNQGVLILDSTLGSPTLGTWYHVLAELNVASNKVGLVVNNGTASELSSILQPLPVAGKIGNGSQFATNTTASFATRTSGWDFPPTVAGNNHTTITANSDVSIGNNSKTVWGWFKTTNAATTQTLMGSWLGASANTDWILQISASKVYWVLGHDQAFITVNMSDTNWHLVVAWFDKDANQMHLDLDHGDQTASGAGPGVPATSTAMTAGATADNGTSNSDQFLGILNAWGIASGTPTQADLDTLWNNGNGYAYPSNSGILFDSF